MTVEYITLFFTVVAAGAGVVAVYFAGRQERRHPKLVVDEIRLLSLGESEAISERLAAGERPFPDKVLRVNIGSEGELTAFGVVGEIYFEPQHVEPLESLLPTVISVVYRDVQDVPYGVGIGDQGHNFRVASDEGHSIDIPVFVVSSGAMKVSYRFSAPAATPARGAKTVEITSDAEQS